MKTFTIVTVLVCLAGLQAQAQLEKSLMHDIEVWKKGDAPPARLLKFPDGKIDLIPECGLSVMGSSVGYYIEQISNIDLLTALTFDSHAHSDCVQAAIRQVIRLKGVEYMSHLLAEKRKTNPTAFFRPELATLTQLICSPYVTIKVARIATEDMPPEKAETTLREMRAELQSGKSWAVTYGKYADLNPDLRDRATDPKSTHTLVSYLYDTIVSPIGFDILDSRMADNLPVEHLQELFRVKQGTLVLKTANSVYLYHIEKYFDNSSNR